MSFDLPISVASYLATVRTTRAYDSSMETYQGPLTSGALSVSLRVQQQESRLPSETCILASSHIISSETAYFPALLGSEFNPVSKIFASLVLLPGSCL